MRIILDTNEYIFGLDSEAGEVAPGRVLDAIRILIEEHEDFRLLLPEIKLFQGDINTRKIRSFQDHFQILY